MASRLRAARDRQGRQQTEVAEDMRALGFAWSQSTVAAVELDRRDVALDELVALCGLYGVGVRDLLGRRGAVTIGEGTELSVSAVGSALLEGRALRSRSLRVSRVQRSLAESDEATRHAARVLSQRLGQTITAADVSTAARALWECALAAERDARLGEGYPPPGSTRQRQAQRGHVTRALLDELRDRYFALPTAERPEPREDPFPDAVDASGRR